MESFASSDEARLVGSPLSEQFETCLDDWMDSVPPGSLSKKRARKSCLSQISLEKAWAGLSEQLHKFRKDDYRNTFDNMVVPRSSLQGSVSPLSNCDNMTSSSHALTPAQDGGSCTRAKPERQDRVVSTGVPGGDIETRMKSMEHEDGPQTYDQVDSAHEVASCLEAVVADVVKRCELSFSDRQMALKLKQNKIVRFADDCVPEKCRKPVCASESSNRNGCENSLSSTISLHRPFFTRRDMKEMEELLGESNRYSLIRLRRRVGLEPRRTPNLKYVTATGQSPGKLIHNTPWELRSRSS